MKKLLILIVAIALFLHFYPQPILQQWFDEGKESVMEDFSQATETKMRLKSSKIFTDLTAELKQFSAAEVSYLKEITQDRAAVSSFYLEYCKGNKHSPKFHYTNQQKICKTIDGYHGLLQ